MPDPTRPPSQDSGPTALTEHDVLAALMEGVDIDRILSFVAPRPAWMARAACRGMATRSFVPSVPSGPARPPASRLVREVCGNCPVRAQCRDYALAHPELEGWWGGTDAYERRQLRRGSSGVASSL